MESEAAPGAQPSQAASSPRAMMKAIIHTRYGRPDVLHLSAVPVPAISDHEVLVRVSASSVNPVEWYGVTGPYFARFGNGLRRPTSPAVGADVSGRVEALGSAVTNLRIGDEVFGICGGAWAEYASARADRLAVKPANVSFEQAAAVPVAAVTALQALRDKGNVQPGHKVLINGASGGVGTFAVQIAKAYGAEVTAVCSTRNVELVRGLGADRVVDYTREDFTKLGLRHDLMLDIAGSRSFGDCRRVLAPQATVVLVGGRMTYRGLGPLPHLFGMFVSSRFRRQSLTFFVAKVTTDELVALRELIEAGSVTPIIDRTYPLSEAPLALGYLGEGHARGKIAIIV
jgi:NADPH:quinone reductase-like Zn-dependent oxidoreductase